MEVPLTHRVPSERLIHLLDDARARTLALTRDLTGEQALGPKLTIVNPPLWEVGHVGFFHDHFALRLLYGLPDYRRPHADALYDSADIAHGQRWDLPLPDWEDTLDYLARVRDAMVARLPDGLADMAQSYVYQLTTFHEDMHGEAFTYTRQTHGYPAPDLGEAGSPVGAPAGPLPGDVEVPANRHVLGSDESVPFHFDNEKGVHTVDVGSFRIARAPVTQAEYVAFVEADGYFRREYWSDEGWAWRQRARLVAPVYWRCVQGMWQVRSFDRWCPLAPHLPVSHVSAFEADAYCRWAGRRLPTEAEWEVAASRRPERDESRALRSGKCRFPWGDTVPDAIPANLDGQRLGCVDVAAFPEGDSALGCRQMLGNVWEWTASVFGPYPGFRAELYREYSEPWFSERRRVLRGGAWATRSRMIHNGYRNFFTPDRNDVIAGFRTCALQVA